MSDWITAPVMDALEAWVEVFDEGDVDFIVFSFAVVGFVIRMSLVISIGVLRVLGRMRNLILYDPCSLIIGVLESSMSKVL